MKRKRTISKLLTAVFFLAICGNILFTQLFCNFSHLLESAAVPHSHSGGHDHHHGYEALPFIGHTHHETQAPSRDDGKCCNELTSAFFIHQTLVSHTSFSGLVKLVSAHPLAEVPAFLKAISFINSKGFAPSKSPPPKIPDIRIFIHAFQV